MSAREDLLSETRKVLWQAWASSSDEIGSVAAEALLSLGMLVEPGGAQELARLRARIAELEAERRVPFAERARRESDPVRRAAWRMLAESEESRSADRLTALMAPVQALRESEGEHYEHVHHTYRVPHDLPETGGTK